MQSILPASPINIRPATLSDIPFMDGLQKMHSKQVGWMPTKQFEGKIEAGHVLIAEAESDGVTERRSDGVEDGNSLRDSVSSSLRHFIPVGYCIGVDRYFKRDDVGIIYQMNVVPGRQRGFVGATLLRAMFDRAAYGCRLFCLWCAQDIEANRFWEAMGFVPLAFRAGSEKRSRVHIFWQKRIRADDTTTPYWFPSQTTGGAIGAGRIVLPIPPGTHWSDAKPLILPGVSEIDGAGAESQTVKRLPKPRQAAPMPTAPRRSTMGGFRFIATPQPDGASPSETAQSPEHQAERKPKTPRPKNDPRMIAAARELRDRWLEKVNAGEQVAALPLVVARYDVRRALEGVNVSMPVKLLEAA